MNETLAELLARECADDPGLLADLLTAANTTTTDGLAPLVPPRPLPAVLPDMPWSPLYAEALLVRLRAWAAYLEAKQALCEDGLER